MSKPMKELIISYLRLLRKNHLSELLVVPASLITIIIDAVKSGRFISLDLIAILLLSIYLLFVLFDNYSLTKSTTKNVNSGYTIFLGKSMDLFNDSIRRQILTLTNQKVNLKKVNEYFKIIDKDWQFYDPDESRPDEWENKINRIYDHFFTYTQRLPVEAQFHLFVATPVPIALALGFTIGKYRNWIIYQYIKPDYHRIYSNENKTKDTSSSSFTYVNLTENNLSNTSDITVVLSFIQKSDIEIPKMNNQLVEITPKTPTILNEISKINLVAKEIQQIMEEKLHDGKRIHLFPGVPTPIAFLIGRSLQENAPISVYNPNRNTKKWERVFALDGFGQL